MCSLYKPLFSISASHTLPCPGPPLLRGGAQFGQLLVLLQPKERAAIITHFKSKSADADGEKHDGGENEPEAKKGLLASAGGLVTEVGSGKGDQTGMGEEDSEDAYDNQDEEERLKRKDNQILANFFRPVQRQISEIISDVSCICTSKAAAPQGSVPNAPFALDSDRTPNTFA